MTQLCQRALAALPPAVARPAYARQALVPGVVHLGTGNFFRAHAAVYFDDMLAAGDLRWSVVGVNLLSDTLPKALAPQDQLYALLQRDGEAVRARVIGSLHALVAAHDPVDGLIAAPTTHWVTLTITEKAYRVAPPGNGPDAIGLLHAGLVRRKQRGVAQGLSVVSCDNLQANGRLLQSLVVEHDRAHGAPLAGWLDDRVSFPCTMVDRIVPRTVQADRQEAQRLLGVADAWPVPTEPFSQWVIEDHFAGARPELERSGVQVVADVSPYEAMKLRLLNTAHSCLAWLGVVAGLATVCDAVAEPALRRFVAHLWQAEVMPTLPAAVAARVPDYCASLLERFANAGTRHATAQIAMDGSQKIRMRLLPTVRERRAAGAPVEALALGVAAWVRYLGGLDEAGRPFEVADPLAQTLRARLAAAPDAAGRAAAVLAEVAVFGDLSADRVFIDQVAVWLQRLDRQGTLATLAAAF